eukprot:m.15154 g.15154  ORF g.15154 m.15154 type:complete len:345 (+) comp9528_c0_seq1:131-1165(+)
MPRKLASIQLVNGVKEVPDSHSLDVITVLGWEVVVKRSEFQPGDRVVYCEVDSILPEKEPFEFLRSKNFRVKTVKIRKQVSQGICFREQDVLEEEHIGKHEVGTDITEIMGVVKWEPAETFAGDLASTSGSGNQNANPHLGPFPDFIRKTDQPRLQNMPQILEEHKDSHFIVTEKLDGTSTTYFWNKGNFGICSRNRQILSGDVKPVPVYWTMAERLELAARMEQLGRNVAIQGEIIGPKIQKNKYEKDETDFFIFNVYDIDRAENVSFEVMQEVTKLLGLKMVPILSDKFKLMSSVPEMVAFSKDKSKIHKKTQREGVVIRHVDNGEISFKVISPAFLLKYDE